MPGFAFPQLTHSQTWHCIVAQWNPNFWNPVFFEHPDYSGQFFSLGKKVRRNFPFIFRTSWFFEPLFCFPTYTHVHVGGLKNWNSTEVVVVVVFQSIGNLNFGFHLTLEQHWSMVILIILRTACLLNCTDNVSTCFFTLRNLSVVAKWRGFKIISKLLYYVFMYCLLTWQRLSRQKKKNS